MTPEERDQADKEAIEEWAREQYPKMLDHWAQKEEDGSWRILMTAPVPMRFARTTCLTGGEGE